MYEITITGWFAAAHQLRLPDGTLEPLHGHNWRVTATWRGARLDSMGILVDFTKVKPRLDALLAEF
ncbi:MAG: 6-carboxytetrahydropterin synthase, partial [Planctomycetes bacterium]|nr:6-carboxytetrahydropterin synthase [Planctomycetota bacterium]